MIIARARRTQEVVLGLGPPGLAAEFGGQDDAAVIIGGEALDYAFGGGEEAVRWGRKTAFGGCFGGEDVGEGFAGYDGCSHEFEDLQRLRGVRISGGEGGKDLLVVDAEEGGAVAHGDEVVEFLTM